MKMFQFYLLIVSIVPVVLFSLQLQRVKWITTSSYDNLALTENPIQKVNLSYWESLEHYNSRKWQLFVLPWNRGFCCWPQLLSLSYFPVWRKWWPVCSDQVSIWRQVPAMSPCTGHPSHHGQQIYLGHFMLHLTQMLLDLLLTRIHFLSNNQDLHTDCNASWIVMLDISIHLQQLPIKTRFH